MASEMTDAELLERLLNTAGPSPISGTFGGLAAAAHAKIVAQAAEIKRLITAGINLAKKWQEEIETRDSLIAKLEAQKAKALKL